MFIQNSTYTNTVGQFMHKVYALMCIGLLTTACTAYFLFAQEQLLIGLLEAPFLMYGLFFAQIGLVIFLASAINRISYVTAAVTFFAYSVLVGITLTPIFLIYTMSSIGVTFGITAGMFGSMALYGYYTNTDLSKLGSILLMGLYGLIIAMLVNLYFQSSQMEYIISFVGVVVFTLLTAYDVQKIKLIASQMEYDPSVDMGERTNKVAILGALTLYLDFLNLFLYLLRFMGKKRR
jgi:FtsH-binding integral membrane protein